MASQRGHATLVDRLLLAAPRVDVNRADHSGNTPLIAACSRGGMYPEIVRSLVGHGDAEVDVRNARGSTSLIEAARLGHVKIVDILVGGLDADLFNYIFGCTSLIVKPFKHVKRQRLGEGEGECTVRI